MNKKMTIIRLTVYLVLSFGLVWIPTILYTANGGIYESPYMQAILTYSMLCPSIAMVLTRWITKEGFTFVGEGSMKIGISLQNKKWIFYAVAILLPYLYRELGSVLTLLAFPNAFNSEKVKEIGIPQEALWMLPLALIASCCLYSVGALGEEAGWRGYMMPKLQELFGIKGAVLTGGIIWGIWHFPANMAGHNFGTDYWGEPWSGFVSFTIFTVAAGAILTWLTIKSGSVWPAAFMHAVNNGGGSILSLYLDDSKITGWLAEPPVLAAYQSIPVLIIAVLMVIDLCRPEKKKKNK